MVNVTTNRNIKSFCFYKINGCLTGSRPPVCSALLPENVVESRSGPPPAPVKAPVKTGVRWNQAYPDNRAYLQSGAHNDGVLREQAREF